MNLDLHLSPSGTLRLCQEGAEDGWELPDAQAAALLDGFAAGSGAGLLALLREDAAAGAPAAFQYWRNFAREFMTRLCHAPEPSGVELAATLAAALPPQDWFAAEALESPPMRGAEYLSPDVLRHCWEELGRQAQAELTASGAGFDQWLRRAGAAWKQVGKVSFHLAENKQDSARPFAFMATFIHRLSDGDKPRHLPLGAALKAYSADRNALLALLKPVQAAGERSSLIAGLVGSKEIFRPQAWSAKDAHRFLKDIPAIEEAGIVVRIANLWKAAPPKAKVGVTVNLKQGQTLGVGALLDFSLRACLGDEELDEDELRGLLADGDGLLRFKGQWVEVDREKITALLDSWEQARAEAAENGLSFTEGLRLLAGANLGGSGAEPPDPDFCRVKAGGELRQLLEELESPGQIPLPPLPESLLATLRPYQLDGVKWLWRMTELGLGGCLADDMGLGKTLQVLTLLEALRRRGDTKALPALLVVPASLLRNWEKESAKFTPELRFGVLHPSAMNKAAQAAMDADLKGYLGGFDAVATTYGMLLKLDGLRQLVWPAVVVDEAQAIKNPHAKQSKAVRALRGPRRLALTGTPVENRLGDLWSVFDFASPGLLGKLNDFTEFVKRLDGGGKFNYAPLRRLTKPYILRRLKTDKSVISDLPDKTEMKVYCHLSKAQAALYQRATAALAADLRSGDPVRRRGVVFKYLTLFKQICNHPDHYSGAPVFKPEESGKFLRLAELVEEVASRQEKALVFTQFKEMTEPLHEQLASVFGRPGLVLSGDTPIKKRQAMVDQFQAESGPPFFVLSLKAAGTGLNLTAASHVIHFDRWWNPAVENQATDRAYRIGQRRNVLAHKFICKGTVEEKIDALIDGKKELADSLLSEGAEKLLTDMDNEELLRFVALDLNAALTQ